MTDRCGAAEPTGAPIRLSGVVGHDAVGSVQAAVRDALQWRPHVEVDVRGVERWEDDAICGLADCARLGIGVEFRMEGKRRRPGAPR